MLNSYDSFFLDEGSKIPETMLWFMNLLVIISLKIFLTILLLKL